MKDDGFDFLFAVEAPPAAGRRKKQNGINVRKLQRLFDNLDKEEEDEIVSTSESPIIPRSPESSSPRTTPLHSRFESNGTRTPIRQNNHPRPPPVQERFPKRSRTAKVRYITSKH